MFERRQIGVRCGVLVLAGAVACTPSSPAPRAAAVTPTPIMGFLAAHLAAQRAAERTYLAAISADQISEVHRTLTAEPHRATSPRNAALGRWIASRWRAQGWDRVEAATYQAYFSEPRTISLEMVAPIHHRAALREAAIDRDPQTQRPDLPGAFSGYSASGDVTAEVVYARGGDPEDYELLRQRGISVKGRIVLVRYARPYSFRGFKVMTAEREGAAAILIYSDPAEDGAARGPVFPDGPWGPESHIQRGLAAYIGIVPGDPTTPGWASLPGARHLDRQLATTLPRIMVLAISAQDARPLLEHMTGEAAPTAWTGGLPITYRFAGGVTAHLKIEMQNGLRTYTNELARIEGTEHPEQLVILGNHRDAWVYGGADPSSGTAALLELSRALGTLKQSGWRPRRTIVVASWDGEEEGLVGSTEWAEQYADELGKHLVAYLNVDTSIFGVLHILTGKPDPHFEAVAVPSLAPMIVEASHDITVPGGATLYDAWRMTRVLDLARPDQLGDATMVETDIDASSDQSPFLIHLCRPTVELTYVGQYGVYHSIYDDRYYMEHFGDPGFHYTAVVAKLWGLLAMRLAGADLLPFDVARYADKIDAALAGVAATQPLDLAALRTSVAAFRAAATRWNGAVERARRRGDARDLDEVDRTLMAVERSWCDAAGLPGHPWSRHLLYGMRPTLHPLLLPGLREALERSDPSAAQQQAARIAAALDANTRRLDDATARR